MGCLDSLELIWSVGVLMRPEVVVDEEDADGRAKPDTVMLLLLGIRNACGWEMEMVAVGRLDLFCLITLLLVYRVEDPACLSPSTTSDRTSGWCEKKHGCRAHLTSGQGI
jgi:hypothetical protein